MFRWEGTLYQFLYLCFGLPPAPNVFTKLLKIPMALLKRIGIRIIICLVDILTELRKRLIALRDTVTFLLQCLEFSINQKNSVMAPAQELQFLWVLVSSNEITISHLQKKIQSIKQICQDMYQNPETAVLELAKVLGHLT